MINPSLKKKHTKLITSIPISSLRLFINNSHQIRTNMNLQSAEQISFKWDLMVNFFSIIDNIEEMLNPIPDHKLSSLELRLKQLVIKYSGHLVRNSYLPSSDPELSIVHPSQIMFEISSITDILADNIDELEPGEIPIDSRTITVKDLSNIRCFNAIFSLHTFFSNWLTKSNDELLEILELMAKR